MRYLLAFIILCIPVSAHAQNDGRRMTAAELAVMCSSKSDLDYGYCAGYVTSVADGMIAAGSIGGYSACNHAHVKSQQYIDVFSAYAEMFPEKLSGDAETVVAAAVARAFPCLHKTE